MSIDCSLVAITRLGSIAKPLEQLVVEQVRDKHPYAIDALNSINEI
jgi:hypothetical protein